MIRRTRVFVLAIGMLVLSQCGVPHPPACRRIPQASRNDPSVLMDRARRSILDMRSLHGARADRARDEYNQNLIKLLDHLRCGRGSWDERAARIGTVIDRSESFMDPDRLDALVDVRSIRFRKLDEVRKTDGLGVAAVGWVETSPVGSPRDPYLLPNGIPYHLNVILNFDGNVPRWEFRKRWRDETVSVNGREYPLAANWSAANEFYWKMCQLDDLLIQNVILPERYTQETGLYFVTPYDPAKIPVVFVHGLVSSPDAFKNTLNHLMPQKWFRDRYQVWLYNYPTGNPWIYSSMIFREKMREAISHVRAQGPDHNLRRMVLVCHSMGGLLCRSSVTDPGHTLYDSIFTRPVESLPVRERTREMIRRGLLYEPLAEPDRVVMMAVPHRGSPMATWGPSVWISRLIRLPKTLTVDLLDKTLHTVFVTEQGTGDLPAFSSINSLSPVSPATKAMASLPLPKGVAFHSIIGDRGKGDTPESSDGVVPYWSSHVEPVASEFIVPSGHGVPDSPEAADELERILKLHLNQR